MNTYVIEEMRNLQARLEAMEVAQRRGIDTKDVSDREEESSKGEA